MTQTETSKVKHKDGLFFCAFGEYRAHSLSGIAKKISDSYLNEYKAHLDNDFPMNTNPNYSGPDGLTSGDMTIMTPIISPGFLALSVYCTNELVRNYQKLSTQDLAMVSFSAIASLAFSAIFGLAGYRNLVDYNRAKSIVEKRMQSLESIVKQEN